MLTVVAVGGLGLLGLLALMGGVLPGCAGGAQPAGRVSVAELAKERAKYEGVAVSMVLTYGERQPEDTHAHLRYRSDGYLHDETGTIMATGAWLINQSWRGACKSYEDERVKIGLDGVWLVKKALVAYDDKSLPYLQWEK